MASAPEVQKAWLNQKLDVYAFGRMADGRFAVPVQKEHSNFKKGANIGASGGNQGFFYTTSENVASANYLPNPNIPKIHEWLDNGYVRIRSRWKQYHYLHSEDGQLKDGPVEADQLNAQWKIIEHSKNYMLIQNRANPELYLNNSNGKLEVKKIHHVSTSSAHWKVHGLPGGWSKLENGWFKGKYIHNQNGKLEIGEVDPQWAGYEWEIR